MLKIGKTITIIIIKISIVRLWIGQSIISQITNKKCRFWPWFKIKATFKTSKIKYTNKITLIQWNEKYDWYFINSLSYHFLKKNPFMSLEPSLRKKKKNRALEWPFKQFQCCVMSLNCPENKMYLSNKIEMSWFICVGCFVSTS